MGIGAHAGTLPEIIAAAEQAAAARLDGRVTLTFHYTPAARAHTTAAQRTVAATHAAQRRETPIGA